MPPNTPSHSPSVPSPELQSLQTNFGLGQIPDGLLGPTLNLLSFIANGNTEEAEQTARQIKAQNSGYHSRLRTALKSREQNPTPSVPAQAPAPSAVAASTRAELKTAVLVAQVQVSGNQANSGALNIPPTLGDGRRKRPVDPNKLSPFAQRQIEALAANSEPRLGDPAGGLGLQKKAAQPPNAAVATALTPQAFLAELGTALQEQFRRAFSPEQVQAMLKNLLQAPLEGQLENLQGIIDQLAERSVGVGQQRNELVFLLYFLAQRLQESEGALKQLIPLLQQVLPLLPQGQTPSAGHVSLRQALDEIHRIATQGGSADKLLPDTGQGQVPDLIDVSKQLTGKK